MAELKTPLFNDRGAYNRERKRWRVNSVKDLTVSDGTVYHLWERDGVQENDYPHAENDKHYLYVEINGWLAPLRITDWRLSESLDTEQKQADWIGRELERETELFLRCVETGGHSHPSFIGAAALNRLDECEKLRDVYRRLDEEKQAARLAWAEAEEKRREAEQAEQRRQTIQGVIDKLKNGGRLTSGRELVDTADALGVKIHLRTRGWILDTFANCEIDRDGKIHVQYYKRGNGTGSTKIFEVLNSMISAAKTHSPSAA